uniref:Peptidoglycan-associated lipoprotein n=1 Tax=Acidobacterium capsulatum TaxID=33075 RepID=A0A7V4XQ88_9BACT
MKHAYRKSFLLSAGLVAMLTISGCHKKVATAPVPAPPPAMIPAPTASISANPQTVTAGNPVVLTWQTTNATNVSIDGIGQVETSGTQTVTPTQSTNYHLVATGQGGSTDATVHVTVTQPQAATVAESNIDEATFEANVKPVFYNFDSYSIRPDAQAIIQQDANYLIQHPNLHVVIGGYCDDRGSVEYNLALGENRANAAKQALVSAGVSPDRLRTVSYGKEKQFCTEQTEACWQSNRRAQFTLDQ